VNSRAAKVVRMTSYSSIARSSLFRGRLLQCSRESMAIWRELVNGMAFLSSELRARDLRSSRLSRIFSILLREGGALSCAPSADAVAGKGRPLIWGRGGWADGARPEPSADAVAGGMR